MKNSLKIGMLVAVALGIVGLAGCGGAGPLDLAEIEGGPPLPVSKNIVIDSNTCPGTWVTYTNYSVCTLTSDLNTTETVAIYTDNTALDCNGFAINKTGSLNSPAVFASGAGIKVTRCVISNTLGGGIKFQNVHPSDVVTPRIGSNDFSNILGSAGDAIPIHLTGSTDVEVWNNYIYSNSLSSGATGITTGVYLSLGSNNNQLIGNNVNGGYTRGFGVFASDNNTFYSNYASFNTKGAEVLSGDGNVFDLNSFEHNDYGLVLYSLGPDISANTIVTNNILCGNVIADYRTYPGASLDPSASHIGNSCDLIIDDGPTGFSCDSACVFYPVQQIMVDCMRGEFGTSCTVDINEEGLGFILGDDLVSIGFDDLFLIGDDRYINPIEAVMAGTFRADGSQLDVVIGVDDINTELNVNLQMCLSVYPLCPSGYTMCANGACLEDPLSPDYYCPQEACSAGEYMCAYDLYVGSQHYTGLRCGSSPEDCEPCPAGYTLCSENGGPSGTCIENTLDMATQCAAQTCSVGEYLCGYDLYVGSQYYSGLRCGSSPEDCEPCPTGYTLCSENGGPLGRCIENTLDVGAQCATPDCDTGGYMCESEHCSNQYCGSLTVCGSSPEDCRLCPPGYTRCINNALTTCIENTLDPSVHCPLDQCNDGEYLCASEIYAASQYVTVSLCGSSPENCELCPEGYTYCGDTGNCMEDTLSPALHCPNACAPGEFRCGYDLYFGSPPQQSVHAGCGSSPEDCEPCAPGWGRCISEGVHTCVAGISGCPNSCGFNQYACQKAYCTVDGCYIILGCADSPDCDVGCIDAIQIGEVEIIVLNDYGDNETAALAASIEALIEAEGISKIATVDLNVDAMTLDALIDGSSQLTSISRDVSGIEPDLLAKMIEVPLDRVDVSTTALSMDDTSFRLESSPALAATFELPLVTASITVGELDKILNSFFDNQIPYYIVADSNAQVAHIIVTIGGVDQTVTGEAVEDMLSEIDLLLGTIGSLEVRCGVRGGENRACGPNTEVTLHEKACAVLQGNDPADVVDNCPMLAFSNTPDSVDDKFAHYSLTVASGQYFLVATDPDMLDPMGMPVQSSHPTLSIPEDTFANVIMHVKPDGKNQGMKSGKQLGSVLWVHEPTDVVWVDAVEYYPFFFESDSDWTVDVCLEVPQGYVIIEGEECLQTFVADEERTILFKVQEVGSIPFGFKSKKKFRNPAGKMTVEHEFIGVRLHPKLSLEKAEELLEKGYTVDPRTGKVKRAK